MATAAALAAIGIPSRLRRSSPRMTTPYAWPRSIRASRRCRPRAPGRRGAPSGTGRTCLRGARVPCLAPGRRRGRARGRGGGSTRGAASPLRSGRRGRDLRAGAGVLDPTQTLRPLRLAVDGRVEGVAVERERDRDEVRPPVGVDRREPRDPRAATSVVSCTFGVILPNFGAGSTPDGIRRSAEARRGARLRLGLDDGAHRRRPGGRRSVRPRLRPARHARLDRRLDGAHRARHLDR